MTTQIQRRRGTTAEHSTFTGAAGEITIDTTKNTVVVHDGTTTGGFPLAKESGVPSNITDLSDVTITSIASGEILKWSGSEWVNNTPAEAGLLTSSDIGVTIQAYDANLPTWPASVDATEVGYLDGVTSNIQTQLDAKVETLGDLGVTATATELNYVDGVTSNIQTQIDAKAGTGKAIAMAIVFG